jgi:hypothetical protein
MISNTVDTDNALSPMTQKHVRKCSDCRAFYQACLAMGETLKRQAAGFDEDLPANFAQRVFDAASAEGRQTFKLPVRWLRPVLIVASIAVIALLAVALLTFNKDAPPSDSSKQFARVSRLMDDGNPTAWTGFVGRPLSKEIDNLTEGTESAVRFLVACVAVSPAKTPYEPPD